MEKERKEKRMEVSNKDGRRKRKTKRDKNEKDEEREITKWRKKVREREGLKYRFSFKGNLLLNNNSKFSLFICPISYAFTSFSTINTSHKIS